MKSVAEQIGVPATAARRGLRRVFTLAIDELHPAIRIAHIQPGALRIPERIIFDHEMVLFLRGAGKFHVGKQVFDILPYRLFILGPYQPHAIFARADTPCEHAAVHFDLKPGFPPFSQDVSRRSPYEVRLSHGLAMPLCVNLSRGNPIAQCLVDLIRIRATAAPTATLEASSLLLRAILLLLKSKAPANGSGGGAKAPSRDQQNQAKVQRVLDHIQEHSSRDLPIAELCRVARMSPAHLARQFALWTGQTPAEYVRRTRVAKARRLLAQVDLSMKEIATATGFKNPYHFSRVFRQVDGLAPTFYREAILAQQRR